MLFDNPLLREPLPSAAFLPGAFGETGGAWLTGIEHLSHLGQVANGGYLADSVSMMRDYGIWYRLEVEIEKALESRRARRVVERLVAELPSDEEPKKPREPIQAYFEDRIARLRHRIRQLSEEIQTRHELENEFLAEIDYQMGKAATSLKEFHAWGIGYNTGVDVKRNFLERLLANLRKERRNAELRTWEDVVALRRDLREAAAQREQEMFLYCEGLYTPEAPPEEDVATRYGITRGELEQVVSRVGATI